MSLVLLYCIGSFIVIQAALFESMKDFEEEIIIANPDRFNFIISIFAVAISALGVFFQSCLYKVFLTFFQLERSITFTKNFKFLLIASLPFIMTSLFLYIAMNDDLLLVMTNIIFIFVNIFITNIIYIMLVKFELNLPSKHAAIIGMIIIVFNVFLIAIGIIISPFSLS